jgi:hypothetical protein
MKNMGQPRTDDELQLITAIALMRFDPDYFARAAIAACRRPGLAGSRERLAEFLLSDPRRDKGADPKADPFPGVTLT